MRLAPFFAMVISTAVLAGCTGRANVNAGYGASARNTAGGSTTTSSGSVGVQIQGGSAAAAVIGIAVMGVAIHGAERAESRAGSAGFAPRSAAPPLDETRTVREVDCSRPIEDYSANIKCK